jgi:drug/metabolite transporter (DMT)-like permease
MSRLRADALLLLVAVIWGFAFIAQKAGMQSLGPFGFGGGRFLLSFLVVLPFAMREVRKVIDRRALVLCVPLCIAFFGGVILQQLGLQTTSVTNAGFLTGLYVIFTPLLALVFYRKAPGPTVWVACAMACAGTSCSAAGGWMRLLPVTG